MRYLLCFLFVAITANAETAYQGTPSAAASVTTANELAQPEIPQATSTAAASITAKTALKESEIPVQLEQSKKISASDNPFFKVIAGILGVAILGFGGIIFIKRYMRNSGEMKTAPQIKVLTQHYLGPKKHLAIVRVAGESILIGITDHNISMLKSLSLLDDEIPEEAPATFTKVLDGQQAIAQATADEDFSISGIKDFVSNRLKGMRSLD
jgi:flagellar protein FliO/FliZ